MKKIFFTILMIGLLCSAMSARADANNVIMLHLNGSFADTTGRTWTPHGNATVNGTQFKFGGNSAIFDGAGDYIDTPDTSNLTLGAGDFTVDFWLYLNGYGTTAGVIFGQCDAAGTATSRSIDANVSTSTHQLISHVFYGSSYKLAASTATLSLGTWYHIALVRSGNTYTQYINGTADGMLDLTGITINNSASKFSIGRVGELAAYYLDGNVDEFRLSNIARWTTDFIPPSQEYDYTPPATATPLGTGGTIPLQNQGNLKIFILAGQSNMVGTLNTPPQNQETSSTIWNFKDYRWEVAREPLTSINGYGPGMPAMLRLQEIHPDWLIGIVDCAVGGTNLGQWQRSSSEDTLYGACLEMARAASVNGQIAGMFFFQGETDAEYQSFYYHGEWGSHFSDFVSALRSDISPDLPIVFVQIGDLPHGYFPYEDDVQAAQAAVVLPNVSMVSAVGLQTLSDGVHLTVTAEQTLGEEMADAMDGLIQ